MKRAICIGLLIATVGCASMSAKKELKGAMAAVQSAQSAGADRDPEAKPRLSQAESALAQARELMQGGNSKGAKTAAESAYQYAEEALEIVRGKSKGAAAAALLH
jgi:hypothetical protein